VHARDGRHARFGSVGEEQMPNFVEEHYLAVAGKRKREGPEEHVPSVGGDGGLELLPLIVLHKCEVVVCFVTVKER
jgi:hypothetical protein